MSRRQRWSFWISGQHSYIASLVVLFCTLVCGSVSGQEPAALDGAAEANPSPSYRLTGTLISPSNRVAILNGNPSREGDRVDGAEIVSIEAGAVRIRTGSRELMVYLRSNVVRRSLPTLTTHGSGEDPLLEPRPESNLPAGSVRSQDLALARFDTQRRHGPVQRGETLSGIAQHYLSDGITLNQMMIALFEANPRAFSGNINVLHEGAVLRVPDGDELLGRAPAAATAEVGRHEIDWRDSYQRQSRLTEVADQRMYGPVGAGEALSVIAESISPEGVTTNQMMIALFDANPHAFSGNINVLHEGAVLRIPDGEALRSQPHEIATAEFLRQTNAWQAQFHAARSTESADT